MYWGRSGFGFIVEIVFGFILVWNCLAALLRREDVYDAQSRRIMFWSLVVGMLIGAGLVIHGLVLMRLLLEL